MTQQLGSHFLSETCLEYSIQKNDDTSVLRESEKSEIEILVLNRYFSGRKVKKE